MEKLFKVLAINPGSTSTKIAVYENEEEILEKTLRHSSEEIDKFEKIADQLDFRKDIIESVLKAVSYTHLDVYKRQVCILGRIS